MRNPHGARKTAMRFKMQGLAMRRHSNLRPYPFVELFQLAAARMAGHMHQGVTIRHHINALQDQLINLMADAFAEAGFVFVKHNFSHDGTTVEHPTEFVDQEAFGHNNFSKELNDLGVVIDWVCSDAFPVEAAKVNKEQIYLIGHSRGGGIVMLKAGEDARVKKVSPWNSVNEFGKYWKKEEMEKIKTDGVIYVTNSRTKQSLPIYWQMYEDYFAHLGRLYIPDVVRALRIPMVIVHGT